MVDDKDLGLSCVGHISNISPVSIHRVSHLINRVNIIVNVIVNFFATITTNVIIVTMINNIFLRQFSWPPFADVHQAG